MSACGAHAWLHAGDDGAHCSILSGTRKLTLSIRRSLEHESSNSEGNFISADKFFKSINGKTGALMPSTAIRFTDTGDNFNLPALNFTQFFFALRSVEPSENLLLHYK